ncbi:unnamed protein product [Didymodactylos carnosus]|uniref:SAM domain-containing protein n=1 Tax=Didymodactylos carnosus TaxID=1234261 RepID=A0A814NPP0_9BILA|nr:unnamed protein product [Didymodactylos carnosus]CAF3861986.1 unnamed protein product [Didymodactylos carnosus]
MANNAPLPASIANTTPDLWSLDQVSEWLRHITLGQYVDKFRENEISGETLVSDDFDEELMKELVPLVGHRTKLKREQRILKSPPVPQFPIPAPPRPPSPSDPSPITDKEIAVLQKCFKSPPLLQMRDLMEAGEFRYTDKTAKQISQDIVQRFLDEQAKTFPEFAQECLVPIMFLSKRLQNLDHFMEQLMYNYQKLKSQSNPSSSDKKTVNLNLRAFLHILLLSSDIFLRRIIMSLISKRNPVPFVEPNIDTDRAILKYEIMASIVHSSLLNLLFQSPFERHIDSVYFQSSIDIDFGYAFIPERPFNLADSHGQLSQDLLTKIHPLFDGFLIHISQSDFDQYIRTLFEYLSILPREKYRLILVRDETPTFDEQASKSSLAALMQDTHTLSSMPKLLSLMNASDSEKAKFAIKDLREQLLQDIKSNVRINNTKEQLVSSLHMLLKQDDVNHLNSIDQIIKPLKDCLLSNDPDVKKNSYPLYLKFLQLCKLCQNLSKIRFYGSESESQNSYKITLDIFQIESEMSPNNNPNQKGLVFQHFFELLHRENLIMILNTLSSELRQELLKEGFAKLAGNLTVEQTFLSLEALWRNCSVCYDHLVLEDKQLIIQSYRDYIRSGYPFEIIDGDNFHCQDKYLTEVMQTFGNEKILAISIIGQQNTGKSTLLNYMFGSLFDVREGRCTRGIYGSLIKVNNITGIDYILLIDTEGLLSSAKNDEEYDRRLVLFCLSVSHLVIVNTVGEINQIIKRMLALCIDSLKQLELTTIQQPDLQIVRNKEADPNIQNHIASIKNIISELRDSGLGETVNISEQSIHTLPNAFKTEHMADGTGASCLHRTEPDFIERTQKFVSHITASAKSCFDKPGNTITYLPQWLQTAILIFDVLQKFPDLTYFKDIKERRQEDEMHNEVRGMISTKFSAERRKDMIKAHCDKNEDDIRDIYKARFGAYKNELNEDLETFFRLKNASKENRERGRSFLERQINEIGNAWRTLTIQANDRRKMEAYVKNGGLELQGLIDSIIASGRTMTREEAVNEFNNMWNKKLEHIEKSFIRDERLLQAINFVYAIYNLFEKKMLPTHEHILLHKRTMLNELIELQHLPELPDILQEAYYKQDVDAQKQQIVQRLDQKSSTLTRTEVENFKHLNKQAILDYLQTISNEGKFDK